MAGIDPRGPARPCHPALIVLINGAFGIGKTTVARALVARLPRAVLFDPEIIGIALQRLLRLAGLHIDDFQDLKLWRRLTVAGLRIARAFRPNVVVPMAFSNGAYLQEIRSALHRFEPDVFHVCLVAPVEVVHERLRDRGADPTKHAWQFRRASECCRIHESGDEFGTRVDASGRDPHQLAAEVLDLVRRGTSLAC